MSELATVASIDKRSFRYLFGEVVVEMAVVVVDRRLLRRSAAVYDDRGEARIVEKRLFAMELEPFVANDLA